MTRAMSWVAPATAKHHTDHRTHVRAGIIPTPVARTCTDRRRERSIPRHDGRHTRRATGIDR